MWIHLLSLGLISGAGGGGPTYTLAANGASYTYSGTDASLVLGRVLPAAAGSYTYAGQDAGLLFNHALAAAGTTYAYSGQDATLTYTPSTNRTLTADSIAYAYAGTDAQLVYSGTPAPAPAPSTAGAPGGARPFVAYINGQRFSGSYWQIRRLIEEYAEQQAEKEITSDKPPKKPRIVVEPGKAAPKQAPSQVIPEAEGKAIQTEMRHTYQIAYARAKLALQLDEEDALMVLL